MTSLLCLLEKLIYDEFLGVTLQRVQKHIAINEHTVLTTFSIFFRYNYSNHSKNCTA